jgi:bifunctional oxygenase/reductase
MSARRDPQDPRSLAGKTALVSGASRGIGRAVATRLAARGALVAVHYGHGRIEAEEVVTAIVEAGHAAFAVGADLSQPSAAEDLFEALDAELVARTGGRDLDILVK